MAVRRPERQRTLTISQRENHMDYLCQHIIALAHSDVPVIVAGWFVRVI